MSTETPAVFISIIFSAFNTFFCLFIYTMVMKEVRYLDKKIHDINLNSYKTNRDK